MSSLPAADYISNAGRKSGEVKVAVESVRSCVAELMGGGAETTLMLVAGVAAPGANAARFFSIEGEAGAPDDFTAFDLTQIPDGATIAFRCANASHVITTKHNVGGDGKFSTVDGNDIVLDDVRKVVLAKRTGTIVEVLALFNFSSGGNLTQRVVAKTADYTIKESDCGTLFTNEGAGGDETFSLPPAAPGLWFDFATVAAHKLKALAGTGDVIGDQGGTDSASAGYFQSGAAKGNTIRLVAVGVDRWQVMAKGGTWTIDS